MGAEDHVGPQAYMVNTLHVEPFSEIERHLSFIYLFVCLFKCAPSRIYVHNVLAKRTEIRGYRVPWS